LNQNGAVTVRNAFSYSSLGVLIRWGNGYPSSRPDLQRTSWFILRNQESFLCFPCKFI